MNTRHQDPVFSFELFPPKTPAGLETMQAAVKNLGALGPAFFSVTYGAGGSTRDRTFATVDWLCQQGITTAPHLSCIGAAREELAEILRRYRSACDLRLMAQPNAGKPELVGSAVVYHESAEEMAESLEPLLGAGARLVGACCGSTPEHISALRKKLDQLQ